jgi:hypothetical protein
MAPHEDRADHWLVVAKKRSGHYKPGRHDWIRPRTTITGDTPPSWKPSNGRHPSTRHLISKSELKPPSLARARKRRSEGKVIVGRTDGDQSTLVGCGCVAMTSRPLTSTTVPLVRSLRLDHDGDAV